jgi:DNA polymerase-1
MEPRLLLIDTTGLIFRAYYSIRAAMTTPEGIPVNAVFGVLRMVLRVFKDVPATASAFTFDAGKVTFRNDMYADYKAQRPEPPDDLRPQFNLSIQMAETTGAPVYVEEGFEADDIIATLARQGREAGYRVSILTGDRDILQLLDSGTEVLLPGRRGTLERNTVDSFSEKYEFPVERFVDYKAIMGDPSDNIPGIKGIGEKGAAKLVSTYGKLEQIYGNLDMVKPDSMRKKLAGERENVFLYRELVTLKPDVPVEYDFSTRTLPDFGCQPLQELLEELGFGRVRHDAAQLGDLMAELD